MTAYRQQALACAAALLSGPLRPRDLKPVAPPVGGILLRNVYGWFERVERGVYRLAASGAAALRREDGSVATHAAIASSASPRACASVRPDRPGT